jgi:betR domain
MYIKESEKMIQKNLLNSKMVLHGRTQRDLAKFLGLSEVSVNKKFQGILRFNVNDIKRIKDYLHLTDSEVVEIFLS